VTAGTVPSNPCGSRKDLDVSTTPGEVDQEAQSHNLVPRVGRGYRIEFSDEPWHPEWDAFVEGASGGSHVQTSLWGQVKAAAGWEPLRVLVRSEGRIVAGAQALTRRLPLKTAVAYVPKGPVTSDLHPDLSRAMTDALTCLGKEHHIRHVSVQPPNNGHEYVASLLEAGYRPSGAAVAPVATVQIDLHQDPDALLANMRKNHRRYVRHGLRQGMVCRLGTHADLPTFYDLTKATSERQAFEPYPFEHFELMWRLLHPPGFLQLFITEYHGEPVSAQLAVAFGDRVIAKNSGWSGQHGSLGPNHVMEWVTMRWAQDHGFRYYDLEGIDIEAARLVSAGESLPERLRRSHSFYKLGFGGDVTIFPQAFVSIPNPILRRVYWSAYPRLSANKFFKSSLNHFRTRWSGNR
jgi:peptidoglycan pentaglycine glycine transferase (the first glycine)